MWGYRFYQFSTTRYTTNCYLIKQSINQLLYFPCSLIWSNDNTVEPVNGGHPRDLKNSRLIQDH